MRGSQYYIRAAFTLLACMLAGCKQPTTFEPGVTDEFVNHSHDDYIQASRLLRADYFFVLDYSYSMAHSGTQGPAKVNALLDSMENFASYVKDEEIDYRISITKGTTHAGSVSTIATDFMAPFMTIDTFGSLDTQIINQIKTVGAPLQENRNFLLEAARRTMNAQNEKFLRKGSQLVYVWVSDTDDQSDKASAIQGAKTPEYYAAELGKFKSNPCYINARAIVAGMNAGCEVPSERRFYEEPGARIARTAQLLNTDQNGPVEQQAVNCVYNSFDQTLEDLARNVRKPTSRFELVERPLPGTLEIYVNGNYVDPESGVWHYESGTNEVVFTGGKEPAPDATLVIRYKIAFLLSYQPKPETIKVMVDGVELDDSLWTYVPEDNRIEFNGDGPSEDAKIRVTYQPK